MENEIETSDEIVETIPEQTNESEAEESAIIEKELYYSAELPDSFKSKHPEMFLLPEDLDGLDNDD